MLALSTVWNAGRRETGFEVIKEIQDTGISCVELNFFLDSKMVEEILDYCQTHGLSIISLHNFCPVPDGLERSEERRVGKECRSRWSPYH